MLPYAVYFTFASFSASDNIPKADEIRTLIKDVWDTRIAKLRVSADSFVRQQEAHAKVGVPLASAPAAASPRVPGRPCAAERFPPAFYLLRLSQAGITGYAFKKYWFLIFVQILPFSLNQKLLNQPSLFSRFSWII